MKSTLASLLFFGGMVAAATQATPAATAHDALPATDGVCTPFVLDHHVSDRQALGMIEDGWFGRSDDGIEALYPPGCPKESKAGSGDKPGEHSPAGEHAATLTAAQAAAMAEDAVGTTTGEYVDPTSGVPAPAAAPDADPDGGPLTAAEINDLPDAERMATVTACPEPHVMAEDHSCVNPSFYDRVSPQYAADRPGEYVDAGDGTWVRAQR